ncbi:hypothetical protein HY570_01400 [Candidatus Micrarchaeota archaeon]|nr:hypothetical protein [Candidatus Micrarchaeota archaeon]
MQLQILKYLSVPVLIAANIVPLIGVFYFGWSIVEVILLYWSESAIIGFFNIAKMWIAKGMPKQLMLNDRVVMIGNEGDLRAAKLKMIPFFALHYGIFMFVHLIFLITFIIINNELSFGLFYSLVLGFIFLFLSHVISFWTNYIGRNEYESADVGSLFMYPYRRIILMHVAVLFGAILAGDESTGTLVILILGKTVFDLFSHINERNDFGFSRGSSEPL